MSEVKETRPKSSPEEKAKQKIAKMLWSKNDAVTVGDFLSTRPAKVSQKVDELWLKTAEITDFEAEEVIKLLETAESFASSINLEELAGKSEYEKGQNENIPEDEYTYSSIKRAEVILQITSRALRGSGIWGASEARRTLAHAAFRPDEKSNFSEVELFDKEASGEEYVPPEEGGPNLRSVIKAPAFKESRRLGDRRVRRSLAHEIAHNLRALTNKQFWRGFEEKARSVSLREPSTPEKKRLIGGFYVGSNKQGSEAIGGLFAAIVDYKARKGNYPTINEVTPDIAKRFKGSLEEMRKKVEEFKKELEKYNKGEVGKKPKPPASSYFAARFALLSHLLKLKNQGFGEISSLDFLSLGTYGYVSFEKIPSLIRLGVSSKEKYEKMRKVIKNIADWLTEEKEEGFKPDFQNT